MRTQTKNRACNGKEKYTSKIAAKKRLRPGMQVYRCKFCGGDGWHLGHRGVYRRR